MSRPSQPERPLLLVGAGGLARETLELIGAVNRWVPTLRIAGLLDDDPRQTGRIVHGVPVLGPAVAVHEHPDALVVLCVASAGDPLRRLRLAKRLALPIERYATLVHPTAVIPPSASVGAGSIVHAVSVLTADVELGAHVVVMPSVVLTHDDRIAEGVTLGAGARIAGGVTIGRGAYVGSGALVREQLVIGAGAVVGMGAVVTRDVPAGEVWAGVPAVRLRSADALTA